jgi:hypothetical protein
MKITLTNAHRIRKSLEGVIASKDFIRGIKTSTTFSVFEKDVEKEASVKKSIETAQKQFTTDVASALSVVEVLGRLRNTIAEKNRELNVGELLDREANVKARIRVFTEITQTKVHTDSLHVTCGRIAHMKAQNSDPNSRYSENELRVNFVDEKMVEHYSKLLVEAKREQRSVLDKISGVNSMNSIEISNEDYAIVEKLGIL